MDASVGSIGVNAQLSARRLDGPSMEYVLTGFSQDKNIRLFAFDGIDQNHCRTPLTVGVDISLIRKYAISLQDLPLLVRRFLDEQAVSGPLETLTVTEAEMAAHAGRRIAAQQAAEERKTHRKPFRKVAE